jgi:ubiquinone/menaquinone biosynthesis C-methylase UbiE
LLYLVPRLSSRRAHIGAIGHVGCLESGRNSFHWIKPAAVYDDEGSGVMNFDHDAYRAQSLATWGEMATGWEDRRDWMMNITGQVNSWLVKKADPQPGQNFLDIATGAGDLSIAVAECVGGGGHVISSDFAPKMVDVARRNGLVRGLTNIEYRVMDAEEMKLGDNSVDGVVCRWGYMLMADPAMALRETRRVLRDAGRLAFAVWTTPDRNPWASMPAMTLVQRGHLPPPEPGAPGIFAMGDPSRIKELVTEAGFAEPDLEEIEFEFRYADFDDFWDALVRIAGPLARVLNALPEEERLSTRTAIMQSVEPYRNPDGTYITPAATWGVSTL